MPSWCGGRHEMPRSDEDYTVLHFHAKRGSKAMDEMGFLPRYTGTVLHDCMQGYVKDHYRFDHALCNAHLLRECKGIAEHDHHVWAQQMIDLLQESWQLARHYSFLFRLIMRGWILNYEKFIISHFNPVISYYGMFK
ncbi:hypothetical protein EBB07_18190 [Paenibacillaceae bacterium]|nr:hypothetical protein EBB07_18190 [Paenibacillaceae bacterium]